LQINLQLHSTCTTFASQKPKQAASRNKKMQAFFVLLSTCTTFVIAKQLIE